MTYQHRMHRRARTADDPSQTPRPEVRAPACLADPLLDLALTSGPVTDCGRELRSHAHRPD